LHCKIET